MGASLSVGAKPSSWMEQDANGAFRHCRTANFDHHPELGVRVSESAGSGRFEIDRNGKITTQYTMRDFSDLRSPRNRLAAADLERKLFKAACDDPQFDHKSRETLQSRFLQFNSRESIGPIATPPPRVLNNPNYQLNLRASGRSV